MSEIRDDMPMYDATLAKAVSENQQQLAPIGYHPTLTEQMGMRRAQLLVELADLDAAIEKAKEQSGAMGLLDAISKTNVGRNRDY